MGEELLAFTPDGMRSLEPKLRSFALFGLYMGHFSLMEVGLNNALIRGLNVDKINGTILTRNISFADKIKSLKCLVSIAYKEAERMKHISLLNRAIKCGETRNIVAHTPFMASKKTDGIEFYLIKANKELEFPEMDWSVDEVFSHVDEVREVDNELRELVIENHTHRIAQALLNRPSKNAPAQIGPLGALFGLGASIIEDDVSREE